MVLRAAIPNLKGSSTHMKIHRLKRFRTQLRFILIIRIYGYTKEGYDK